MAWKFSGEKEVYVEIAERYENYIRIGVLSDGDKLPSVRAAAEDCGVNPNTVARAYALLEKNGLIKTLPKKGIYVSHGQTKQGDDDIERCIRVLDELKRSGVTVSQLQTAVGIVYKEESENDKN